MLLIKYRYIPLILATLISLAINSCIEKEEFPLEPYVEFKEVNFVPTDVEGSGKVNLKIFFTDGDGNVGLSDNQNAFPYDYNLFIKLYEKNHGVYSPFIFPDSSFTFNARIPLLETRGSNKTLKGNITYQMYFINPKYPQQDTFKMEIYIKDRALNKSNIATSSEFVIF